jgi:hypothetical protein
VALVAGEVAQLRVTGGDQPLRLADQKGAHLRRVDDEQRVAALIAIEHDAVLAVEADRPVRLQLHQLGQQHLLAERPVEVGGVQRGHQVMHLEGRVTAQARDEMHDPQRGEWIAAARDLGRNEVGCGHAGRRRSDQRRLVAAAACIGQLRLPSPVSIGTPTSDPYSVHDPS